MSESRVDRAVVDDLDLVRVFIPQFAISELSDADLKWLTDRVGLRVSRWAMSEQSLLIPVPKGRRHLFLEAGLGRTVEHVYVLREVGRHLAGDAENARQRAELFALCGTLVPPVEVGDAKQQTAAVARKIGELRRHFGSHWFRSTFATQLYPSLRAILRSAHSAETWYQRGRKARLAGDLFGAETSFRKGATIGRAARDWRSVALCEISLGITERQRGNLPGARAHFRAAEITVGMHPAGDAEARLRHEQFVTEYEAGAFASADRYALMALKSYETGAPELKYLAHDLAACWMMQGKYEQALETLQRLEPLLREHRAQVSLQANICRAAGALGRNYVFDQAWDSCWAAITASDHDEEEVAQALLDMAHGAATLRDARRANIALNTAIALATRRGEAKVVFEAEALRGAVQAESNATGVASSASACGEADAELMSLLGAALV